MRCVIIVGDISQDEFQELLREGWQLLKDEKYPEALEAYDRAIEINPNYAETWINKGGALLRLEKYPEALEAYDRAIEIKPNYADAWQGKAEASYYMGLIGQAQEAIEKALSFDKEDPDFLNTKGVIYVRLGRYEDAVQLFDEAFRKRSNHLFVFNKATALARLHRFEEAQEALQSAIELASVAKDPESKKRAGEYRRHLDRLRGREYPRMWWTWWFGDDGWAGWLKRVFAAFLLAVLLTYVLLPLVTLNTELF